MSLPQDNYTKLPNIFIDKYMAILSHEAISVFLVICRKTFGWSKTKDRISQTQLMEKTGIKHRQTIRKAIQELIENGLIEQISLGKGRGYEYDLDVKSDDTLSPDDREPCHDVTPPLSPDDREPCHAVTPQKKKDTLQKKKDIDAKASQPSFVHWFFQFWDTAYQAATGKKYLFIGGKDGKLAKILESRDRQEIEAAIENFFNDPDPFVQGHLTIGLFISQYNRFSAGQVEVDIEAGIYQQVKGHEKYGSRYSDKEIESVRRQAEKYYAG